MSDKSPFGRSYSLANFSQLSITKANVSHGLHDKIKYKVSEEIFRSENRWENVKRKEC